MIFEQGEVHRTSTDEAVISRCTSSGCKVWGDTSRLHALMWPLATSSAEESGMGTTISPSLQTLGRVCLSVKICKQRNLQESDHWGTRVLLGLACVCCQHVLVLWPSASTFSSFHLGFVCPLCQSQWRQEERRELHLQLPLLST